MTMATKVEVVGVSERPHVTVLSDRCAGCQECSIRCPTGALTLDASRWVVTANDSACVGCRQCERTCPFGAISIDGPVLVSVRIDPTPVHRERLVGDVSEVRSGYSTWSEALAEANRCLTCLDPTCVRGCPAHNDIPGFISAIQHHDLEGAHEILQRTSVLPDVCSRVCNQSAQCEGACTWSLAGDVPVAIGRLERFVADELVVPSPIVTNPPIDLSVGIVGSGPAAVGAAWELLEGGASVTVYEKDDAPGGLMRWGIPDFTLPDTIARRAWDQLIDAGVEIQCNVTIHPRDIDELLRVHDGLILAHGASEPLHLSVPGSDLDGVTDATTFLKGAQAALGPSGDVTTFLSSLGLTEAAGAEQHPTPRVLVLGAGNTAMDVARSARRLGLLAMCVDWLDERFALARPDELEEAREEGVEVRFLSTLVRLEGRDGRVARATLARTEQSGAGDRPTVVEGEALVELVDLVVMAMGYRADPEFTSMVTGAPVSRKPMGVADRRWTASGVLAGPASAFANYNPVGQLALGRERGLQAAAFAVRARTWVIGDALVGPSTVVESMAQGRRAGAAVLQSMPTQPDRDRDVASLRVLVCHEGVGEIPGRAAREVADGFLQSGHDVRVLPMAKARLEELVWADLIVLGSGVDVRGRPAKRTMTWIDGLPRLGGKQVALFCTFRRAPKDALGTMRGALEEKGAVVVAQAAFGRGELDGTGGAFAPVAFGRELSDRVARAKPEEVFVK